MPALFWRGRGSSHVRRCCGARLDPRNLCGSDSKGHLCTPQRVVVFVIAKQEEVSIMRGNAKRRVSLGCLWQSRPRFGVFYAARYMARTALEQVVFWCGARHEEKNVH